LGERTGIAIVCEECPRKRRSGKVKRLRRKPKMALDRGVCLLEQGVPCCGIAAAGGCGAPCPRVDSPCIGCYGLAAGGDFAPGMVAALAAIVDRREEADLERLAKAGIPNPLGLFRTMSLGHPLLRRRVARMHQGPAQGSA
jgi:F420-non-reducing hydrogenase small subunit